MGTVTSTSPASAAVSEVGDRPSSTSTCVECWHPISANDIVCGVVIDGPARRPVVMGFVHVECAPRLDDRHFGRTDSRNLRTVPLG